MLTKSDSDALYPPIASDKDGKISRTNPRPRKLAATAKECPTSLTTRGNASAEMAGGDVPAVGEYAIIIKIPNTPTRGTRASPAGPP